MPLTRINTPRMVWGSGYNYTICGSMVLLELNALNSATETVLPAEARPASGTRARGTCYFGTNQACRILINADGKINVYDTPSGGAQVFGSLMYFT